MMEPTFSRGRKWRIGFSVTIALISSFALVVMANYLAARYPLRYNWSNAAASKLSPMTTRVLQGLTNNVKVIVFFKGRDEPLFASVTALLKDYQAVTPRLEVEYVDYRYPGRGTVVMTQYKLSGATENSQVIFDYNGHVKSVSVGEMSEYKIGKDRQYRREKFKGEQLFTSALLSVTSQRRPKAYFLTGHDENNPDSADDQTGYSRFAKMMAASNVELAAFESLHNREVPDDCSLLVIAGPSTRFELDELQRLNRYLLKGGRMFVIFPFINPRRPSSGLEDLMAAWNVEVGANHVQDRDQLQANKPEIVVATKYESHPITRPLFRSKLGLLYPRIIRSIRATRADAPKTTELVFTSENGFAYDVKGNEIESNKTLPLAVAVEKGGIQGVEADRGATRIVVASSSMSFANAAFEFNNNADFALLAVNWLLSRDALLSEIQPRAISEFQLAVTDRQMKTLEWIFLAGAPGAALLIGVLVWLKRRV